MTIVGKQNILYRLRATIMFVTAFCMALSIAGFFYHESSKSIHVVAGYSSILFSILLALELRNVAIVMIYKDLQTLVGNTTYIVRAAIFLTVFKRIQNYSGFYINIRETTYINQRYGTSVGDTVIYKYAHKLKSYTRKNGGYTSRLGGDNFYIIVPKTKYEDFINFLNNISVEIQLSVESVVIDVSCRAGIYNITVDSPIKNLIFYSSIALSNGRAIGEKYSVFTEQMLEKYSKEKVLIDDSIRALNNNEFVPYYQPKVNAETKELCGCEALVRWIKNGRMISPAEFVPALEKAGAITDIDFRVFELVCADLRDWIDRGINPVKVSTNFSKLHLKDPDFINKLVRIKEKYRIDGKYLEVELTESAGITDFDVIKKFSQEIRDAGMSVSIDDFGTGYSSLSLLQNVKADVVKMDKSFLDNCFNEESKQFIIDIISIVKHQEQQVLFEGVETKEQLDFLNENNVDIIQGFYFDKPLCHSEFEKRLLTRFYN